MLARPEDAVAVGVGNSLTCLAWPDVAERARGSGGEGMLVVVPLGSCEQHGPHLPFSVDAEVAVAVTGRLARRRPGTVLGPAFPYGVSGEHEGFPGTISLSQEAMSALLVDIGRSASRWAARTLFVTGHGGNFETLASATARIRYEGRDAAWWPCTVPDGDAHAGRTETSIMLALRPSSVCLGRAQAGRREPIEVLMPELRRHGVIGVSRNGVLGDPGGASATEGRQLLDRLAQELHRDVAAWVVGADGLLGGIASTPGTERRAPLFGRASSV